MMENQKKNRERVRSQSDRGISGDKNEDISTLESEFEGKTWSVNLHDFPQLSSSSRYSDSVQHTPSNRSQNKKSWLSVVSKGNINFGEEFPTLPGLEDKSNCKYLNNDKRVKSEFMENNNMGKTTAEMQSHKPSIVKENNSSSLKKISSQPPRNPYKKKRSDPVLFNFQGLFMGQKLLNKSKKNNIIKNRSQQYRNKELLSGNYLDSSNPQRCRGKHREIKKKKLTKLKLAIIKERIIKQKLIGKSADFTENACFQLVETIDFKSEIKSYLEELDKKKKQEKLKNTQKVEEKAIRVGKGDSGNQENKSTGTVQNENAEKIMSKHKGKKIPQIQAGGGIKFTSKFRGYCDNILTPKLDSSVSELIKELVKFQDRQYAKDPIKAKAKKRHVSGIREVKKYLTLKKVKFIVIVPDLEKLQMEGGVYDSVNELKSMASEQSVPYAFALNRYMLGRCTKKNVPVSAFAVLNYEGIEKLFESTLQHLQEAKEGFDQLTKPNAGQVAPSTEGEDVNAPIISSLISVFREGLHLSKEDTQFASKC